MPGENDFDFLTVREFQDRTGLSDRALLALLDQNTLPVRIDPKRGLLIDLSAVQLDQLVAATAGAREHGLAEGEQLFTERLSRVLYESLDEIVSEALLSLQAEQE